MNFLFIDENDELSGVENCGAKRSSFPRPSPTTCYALSVALV